MEKTKAARQLGGVRTLSFALILSVSRLVRVISAPRARLCVHSLLVHHTLHIRTFGG